MKIRRRSASRADRNERKKNQKNDARHSLLKIRAEPDAAVVQKSEEQRQRDTKYKPPEKHGLACNAVDLDRIELRKNVRRDFAERDRFPRAHDEIREQHDPSGEIADAPRKNLRRVCGFASCI